MKAQQHTNKQPTILGKQSTWGRLVLCAVIFTLVFVLSAKILGTRYGIYADGRIYKCMPYTLFILDKWHKKGEVGNYYAFSAKNTRMFKNGEVLAKQFVAGFSDVVEIDDNEIIKVNQNVVERGLNLAAKMGREREDFMGRAVIEKDDFYALGSTRDSFDSRYWGTVNEKQIIGQLHPVF